jgi:hypothetical protein
MSIGRRVRFALPLGAKVADDRSPAAVELGSGPTAEPMTGMRNHAPKTRRAHPIPSDSSKSSVMTPPPTIAAGITSRPPAHRGTRLVDGEAGNRVFAVRVSCISPGSRESSDTNMGRKLHSVPLSAP